MDRLQFEVTNKDGSKLLCETIATYHDDETSKDFIVYTDMTFDENKKLKVYYSLYEIIDNNIKLIDITDSNDKKIGLELIKEVVSDVNNN